MRTGGRAAVLTPARVGVCSHVCWVPDWGAEGNEPAFLFQRVAPPYASPWLGDARRSRPASTVVH